MVKKAEGSGLRRTSTMNKLDNSLKLRHMIQKKTVEVKKEETKEKTWLFLP